MKQILRRCLPWFIGAACAAAAGFLIRQVLAVWLAAGDPLFSRGIVLDRLGSIAPVLILCAVCAAAGAAILSAETKQPRIDSLTRLESRAVPPKIARKLAAVFWIGAAGAILAVLPAVLWLAQPGRFASQDLRQMMGGMLRGVLPYVALALAILIAEEQIRLHLAGRALKACPLRQEKPAQHTLARNLLRAGIGVAAAVFLAIGAINGGAWDVLVKAINICTECIGLG